MDEVKRLFKPEFLNRIDEMIVFHSLTKNDIREIVNIMLRTIAGRCQAHIGLRLKTEDSLLDHLAEKGFDEKYGARPLRRAIQTEVEDKLAEELLEGRVQEGDTVTLSYQDRLRVQIRHKRKKKEEAG